MQQNNITYSVDMIRLKTFLTYSVFTEIEFRFKTCWSKYVKRYYTTPQMQQFFYNYVKKRRRIVPELWAPYIEKSSFRHVFRDNLCQYRYKEPCGTILCVYRGALCLLYK